MCVRIATGFLILAVCLSKALADDAPSVDSPVAVRKILDEAAPELLLGHERANEILSKVSPKDLCEIHKLQQMMKDDPDNLGTPLTWEYVGERKLGEVARQYIYVCRYQTAPVIWFFMAMQRNGRWSLAQVRGTTDMDQLFAETPVDHSRKPGDYSGFCDKLIDRMVHGNSGVDLLLKANCALRTTSEKLQGLALKVLGVVSCFGGVVACDRVEVKNVGDVLSQCSYIVQCQNNNGLVVTFACYRADKDWKLLGISIRSFDIIEDRMMGAVLEPALSAPQTAP
jgi:hypothetical protein